MVFTSTIGSDPVGGSGVIRSVIDLAGSSITPLNYHITTEEGFMMLPPLVLGQGELDRRQHQLDGSPRTVFDRPSGNRSGYG